MTSEEPRATTGERVLSPTDWVDDMANKPADDGQWVANGAPAPRPVAGSEEPQLAAIEPETRPVAGADTGPAGVDQSVSPALTGSYDDIGGVPSQLSPTTAFSLDDEGLQAMAEALLAPPAPPPATSGLGVDIPTGPDIHDSGDPTIPPSSSPAPSWAPPPSQEFDPRPPRALNPPASPATGGGFGQPLITAPVADRSRRNIPVGTPDTPLLAGEAVTVRRRPFDPRDQARNTEPDPRWLEPSPESVAAGLSTVPESYEDEADEEDESLAVGVILEWIAVIVGALVVALIIKTFLFQAFHIPSASMDPTLEVGDRVMVNKLSYDLHDVNRGDLVVFTRPDTELSSEVDDLIKRVIGLPGETVEAREGTIYIDGQALSEPYLQDSVITNDFGPVEIPERQMFVMGDNRGDSRDSRVFGPQPVEKLIGRAFVRVWPPSHIGLL